MTDPVKNWSNHEVVSWVESRIAAGTFKRCTHLKVISVQYYAIIKQQVFVPQCETRSFEWKNPCYGNTENELEVLVHYLHTDPISCPTVNYSEKRGTFARKLKKTLGVFRYLAVPFQWFAKLPWQTQFLLVALAILVVAPRWVPQLINLLNAIHGK